MVFTQDGPIVLLDPDKTGRRPFRFQYVNENFNTSPVSDYNAGDTPLKQFLRNFRNCVITKVAIYYTGTNGVSLRPALRNEETTVPALEVGFEKQTTSAVPEWLIWDCSVEMNWQMLLATAWTFAVYVAGYAATDDLYVQISGEVW